MQRILISGLAVVAAGIAWPLLSKLPLGRLPGDFVVDRPGFRMYFPFATSLLVSLLVTLVLWLLRR